MKKLLTAFSLIALCALPAAAQSQDIQLTRGTMEIIANGSIDIDSFVGTDIELELGMGRFVQDYIELGGLVDFRDSDIITSYGVKGFGEYNYDTLTYWIPYVGASLGYEFIESDNAGLDDSGVTVGLHGGVKYFFPGHNNLAWTGQASLDYGTADVYDTDDGADAVDFKLTMGLRYFLPR